MGTVEVSPNHTLFVFSHIVTYGNAANAALTMQINDEIETMWNEPQAKIVFNNDYYKVQFKISAEHKPHITPEEILSNDDPRNNYFRIEAFAHGNISFVDGLGCNTGYFKLENLYKGSTTAAHEYGHTLGLKHPTILDLRGKGIPGIMYPRGTLVDPEFQYDPSIPAGAKGGTMHPMYRKVLESDIALLNIDRLDFSNSKAVIGDFSSVWHPDHKDIDYV
ncbi:M10 family metallopeptidase domain-containing protein [Niabella ginsengisoli]|uniref:M10 family metallopeptidase domain-containing protein n=1 Tax=Niabella ginsengisoli TaxID=522298 RepID=A0ABS9SRV7_9BACT|nr:M10 family metallopeptidase domain-containing protein [Niabella ginsengisoli]MCH5600874.1 M10 family metallopeptidase domain-containing protein [Niabella ginsengisoli]